MTVNVYRANGFVTRLLIAQIEVTKLCVVLTHYLTALLEYVSNGISGVMETMTAETTATKIIVQVKYFNMKLQMELS